MSTPVEFFGTYREEGVLSLDALVEAVRVGVDRVSHPGHDRAPRVPGIRAGLDPLHPVVDPVDVAVPHPDVVWVDDVAEEVDAAAGRRDDLLARVEAESQPGDELFDGRLPFPELGFCFAQ